MLTFDIALTNGRQVIPLPGGLAGNMQLVFTCLQYPSAAALTAEYVLAGGNKWRPITDASGASLTDELAFYAPGVVAAVRITLSGMTGSGKGCVMSVTDAGSYSDVGGVVTEQSFFEKGSIDGQVFETSAAYSLATTVFHDSIFQTGAKPVSIIARAVEFDGAAINLRIYKNPTFTGGTPRSYFGMNDVSQNVGLATIKESPTVTAVGTEIAAPKYLIGVPPTGNKIVQSQNIIGDSLRILAPNTAYLFRVTNTSADTTNITTYTQWHEGDLHKY